MLINYNMPVQFFSTLSQNYIDLLEDNEYCDIAIEVGENSNVKTFRAHMNILCYRSPFLRALASNKNNKNNKNSYSTRIRLSNISPEIFQIILKYIYGGILSLNERDNSDLLKILAAADILRLQELIDYLQRYLIEYESEWMEQHFEVTHRASYQSDNLLELRQFCTNLMEKSPEKIFESSDFTSLPAKSLVSLIKKDDLRMKEVEIWEYVLKWGIAQNLTLISNPKSWSDNNFKAMRNTLRNCLSSIRFFCLSPKEFSQKVRPYKKLFEYQFYEDLSNSYLDPDSVLNYNILPPRNIDIENIDSKFVNFGIISIVSRWIDKVTVDNKFDVFRELYLPYKFKLLLRGSRDGFTPKRFHELCDNECNTVTFIKVRGTEEILGGYNPLEWKTPGTWGWGETKDSFIFSFKNTNGSLFEDEILSNVEDTGQAIYYRGKCGPYFGSDIILRASDESTDYDNVCCRKSYYEKMIRDTKDQFTIEDYEVFQIVKR